MQVGLNAYSDLNAGERSWLSGVQTSAGVRLKHRLVQHPGEVARARARHTPLSYRLHAPRVQV